MNNESKLKMFLGLSIGIIAILIFAILLFFTSNNGNTNNEGGMTLSNNQQEIDIPIKKGSNTEYTEYNGFGEITVTDEYPNVYLTNPEENTVFMQFNVSYNNKELYESGLIAPGMMENLNVYDMFDKGEYTLDYSITTYDFDTKDVCMEGVLQQQDIKVVK